jgi:hypothetical protein
MDRDLVPQARRDGLVLAAFDGELLIQDTMRHRAHALNEQAAAVFRLADGTRSIEQIAADASAELQATVGVESVWYAVGLLQRLHLLEERVVTRGNRLTRKTLLKRAGAAVGLASIATIIVPPLAAHATGFVWPGSCTAITNEATCDAFAATHGCLWLGGTADGRCIFPI